MGNGLDHGLFMRTEEVTSVALDLSRHVVLDHVFHGFSPLISEDVRQLMDDDDVAALHENVLAEGELSLEESGVDLCQTFGATQLRFVPWSDGPGPQPHPPLPFGESFLEPRGRHEFAAPGSSHLPFHP